MTRCNRQSHSKSYWRYEFTLLAQVYNHGMALRNLRRLIGIVIFSISTILLLWGTLPLKNTSLEIQLSPQEMQIPGDQFIAGSAQGDYRTSTAVRETRLLKLTWSPIVRAGDPGLIRLNLEVNETGEYELGADEATQETLVDNATVSEVHETQPVIASTRLEIAVLHITPNNLIEKPLLPGEGIDVIWHVMTDEEGTYQGTVWLYLLFLPLDGGNEFKKPVTAQAIEISSVKLIGLGGIQSRIIGALGILVSAILWNKEILILLRRGFRQLVKAGRTSWDTKTD